jgi:hypothetical protein
MAFRSGPRLSRKPILAAGHDLFRLPLPQHRPAGASKHGPIVHLSLMIQRRINRYSASRARNCIGSTQLPAACLSQRREAGASEELPPDAVQKLLAQVKAISTAVATDRLSCRLSKDCMIGGHGLGFTRGCGSRLRSTRLWPALCVAMSGQVFEPGLEDPQCLDCQHMIPSLLRG